MKNVGSILEFTHLRNADIIKACKHHIRAAKHIVMPEIFKLVSESPSRRFWVSEERASVVISLIVKGKPLPKMRANKIEMFNEINRRFLEARALDKKSTIFELVSKIVNQPAPKFYLTPRTIGEIYHRIKRNSK